jgi:hypothetical protein
MWDSDNMSYVNENNRASLKEIYKSTNVVDLLFLSPTHDELLKSHVLVVYFHSNPQSDSRGAIRAKNRIL